ncbi:MAG: hypothetical protein WC710_11255 [Gallionella sp.]
MTMQQIEMFEPERKRSTYPLDYRDPEPFVEKQKRLRNALLYWLKVDRIHAKPGEVLIEGDSSNGAWIDSWLIPSTRYACLSDLGGMLGVW